MTLLHDAWAPIFDRKGTRSGLNSVKWLGPNSQASAALFTHCTRQKSLAGSLSTSHDGVLTVGNSESPIGFHVLMQCCKLRALDGEYRRQRMAIHVALFLEPGTIVWSAANALPNRQDLLEDLCSIVDLCTFVTQTSAPTGAPQALLPNHFVLAVHEWPSDAPKKAEQDLRDWLLKLEPTFDDVTGEPNDDANERNMMRLLLQQSFLSFEVFAFPESQCVQYKDRIEQFSRSRAISGCLEGWGMFDKATSASVTSLCTLPDAVRLERISKVMAVLEDPQAPLFDVRRCREWVDDRISAMINNDFVEHCEARMSRISATQARDAQQNVLERCKRLADTQFGMGEGASIELIQKASSTLETALQHVLVQVQEKEEERNRQQQERDRAMSLRRASLANIMPVRQEHELWMAPIVVRLVPQAYWFWFTSQGLGVLFVFVTLLLFSLWSRSS